METILTGLVHLQDHQVVKSPTKVERYHQKLRLGSIAARWWLISFNESHPERILHKMGWPQLVWEWGEGRKLYVCPKEPLQRDLQSKQTQTPDCVWTLAEVFYWKDLVFRPKLALWCCLLPGPCFLFTDWRLMLCTASVTMRPASVVMAAK